MNRWMHFYRTRLDHSMNDRLGAYERVVFDEFYNTMFDTREPQKKTK